jgi:hypothetical protein
VARCGTVCQQNYLALTGYLLLKYLFVIVQCILYEFLYLHQVVFGIGIVLTHFVDHLTFYPISILRKKAIFIEKPPVTSSNCYETIKKCFNADKNWHKC